MEKIIIFGAGIWGKRAFEHYGEKVVDFFCDNNNEKAGQFYCGKKIISLNQLKKIHSGYTIVIAVANFYPIAAQLSQHGIENHIYFIIEFNAIKLAEEKKLACIELKENKMLANYVKNKDMLCDYPYLFGKIPEFITTKKQILNVDEDIPYFFKDLSKPLFIRNLSHPNHMKFLFDNVRASEDVAMDNHIYLHYANEQKFLEMLCQCDLKPLLKQRKFVFLIGEQNKSIYPINFKKRYNIDYESMPFKPLRVNELKRIVIYNGLPASGQDFLFQICAVNKNILPILVPTPFLYLPKLKKEVLKMEFNINDLSCHRTCRTPEKYFSLRDPDIFYFLCATFYNNREQKNASRISPTILLDPHHDVNNSFRNVYKSFRYRKGMTLVRNPVMRFGSVIKSKFFGDDESCFFKDVLRVLYLPTFYGENGKHNCFKLESLKNNPIKGVKELCKYFQVPFDKSMLHPEKCQYVTTSTSSTGKKVMGFEPTPKRNISEELSEWDLQRLTPLFEPILQCYGYEYKKYVPLPEKSIKKIYSESFLFEKKIKVTDRNLFLETMLQIFNLVKNGKCYLPPLIDVEPRG